MLDDACRRLTEVLETLLWGGRDAGSIQVSSLLHPLYLGTCFFRSARW